MSEHSHYAQTEAGRRYIESQGGVITETRDGVTVEFPDAPEPVRDFGGDVSAQIEQAVERAAGYGTSAVRLWRERGAGWYAASSHEQHPGFSYVCQIDETNGQPLRCECAASVVCHHLGAAIADWRARVRYEENGAVALAGWQETLDRVRAGMPARPIEEEW